jgi:hypothetical protein
MNFKNINAKTNNMEKKSNKILESGVGMVAYTCNPTT